MERGERWTSWRRSGVDRTRNGGTGGFPDLLCKLLNLKFEVLIRHPRHSFSYNLNFFIVAS